ncbi:hypothetical protein V8C37DRAFT_413718 [Trichoderma ceciliae]
MHCCKSTLPQNHFHLSYSEMLMGVNNIKLKYLIFAGICTWGLLAGYIVFPSAYGAMEKSHIFDKTGNVGKYVQSATDAVPYIFIGSFFCCLSSAGLLYLWWINRSNYIWVSRQIFLPIITHSIMGLGSTLLNIYTVQQGFWSTVSKVTGSIIGGWLFFAGLIFVGYELTIWELKIINGW